LDRFPDSTPIGGGHTQCGEQVTNQESGEGDWNTIGALEITIAFNGKSHADTQAEDVESASTKRFTSSQS
jgi:hypothetical protein